jgi:ABC-type glycerol-3-phosphate transport system permease component
MSERLKGPRWGWIVLTIWAAFALLPIIFFASIALRPRNEIIAPVPIYFPTLTTETWLKIWSEWPIGQYFYNSVMSITGSVLICLVLGIPAAYALARYKFKGNNDIGNYILSTKMMAPAAFLRYILRLLPGVDLQASDAGSLVGAGFDFCGDESFDRGLDHPQLHDRHSP